MNINNSVLHLSEGFQFRGGTSEAMMAANPLLKQREIAVETDTGRFKIGDGIHKWNDLSYPASSHSTFNFPDNDNNIYVIKNSNFVKAISVAKPAAWSPDINDIETVVFALDDDLLPYQLGNSDNQLLISSSDNFLPLQLQGSNTEVNS